MADYQLEIQIRDTRGKGAARKLRAQGRIPGICYGRGSDSLSLSVDPRALDRLLTTSDAGMNTLIDLRGDPRVDGRTVLLKEVQRDPVTDRALHADFYTLDLSRTVEVSVPIHLTGKAPGVELAGGILDHSLRELELECLPTAIPREVLVDVSTLQIGDSVHVREIPLPEGVVLLSDADLSVVSVVAPAVEEVAPAEAAPLEGEVPAEGEAPKEGEAEKAGEESSDE